MKNKILFIMINILKNRVLTIMQFSNRVHFSNIQKSFLSEFFNDIHNTNTNKTEELNTLNDTISLIERYFIRESSNQFKHYGT